MSRADTDTLSEQLANGPDARLRAELRPTSLEVSLGFAVGSLPGRHIAGRGGADPRRTLEVIVRRGLAAPPCGVSFSGGRDSAAILALATHVARRERLPLPIPLTNRFPAVSESDESEWQEQVVRHLDLPDWVRLDWHDELDVLGPVAQEALSHHGLMLPFNVHFHEPLLQRVAGGSLLTGVGGDELFSGHPRPLAANLAFRRAWPARRRLRRLAVECLPRPLRRLEARRRPPPGFGWLTPRGRRLLLSAYTQSTAGGSLRWDRLLLSWWASRGAQCGRAALGTLAGAHGVAIAHPFVEPAAIANFAHAFGPAGPPRRDVALARLLGDLLPEAVFKRRTKASFDPAFFSSHSRAFVERWDGSGVDRCYVDADRLRQEWRADRPDPRSFLLLQHAWLADAGLA